MHLGATESPTPEPAWWEKLMTGAGKLAETYGSVQTTRAIYRINKERTAQGLPPVDASALSPQLNVGVAPGTIKQLSTPLMIGAGLILLMILRKKL